MHAAQGVTADSCHALLAEGSSRAMAYVAMTRGRHDNQAYVYQKPAGEADHEHVTPSVSLQIHHLYRSDKYAAARAFRTILANDARTTTMQAQAEHIPDEHLPDVVADALARNQHRRRERHALGKEHLKTVEAWHAGYTRAAAVAADRSASIALDAGGLEL